MSMTHSQKWLALSLLVVAQFMIVLDISIVNVALPSIERTLGLSESDLQWMVTAYTLAFGGFLLLGGRAADLYGRRTLFLTGLAGFTIVSLCVGLAPAAAFLVPLRALQGLFAALMSPAALSLVLTLFDEQAEKNRALSIWGAVAAGGATAGLLLGGILTQYLSWRWDFFVNVPVGIAVFIAALYLLPAHVAEERTKSLDLPGAVLVTAGLMALVYTLSNTTAWGWLSVQTLGLLALSLALLGGFIYNESVAKHPLMPLSIFRIGNIAAANLMQFPIIASLYAMFFFLTLYVQNVLHYTPFWSGLAFLPVSIIIGITAILAPQALRRIGYKPILVAAPLALALALFILAHVPVDGTYLDMLWGLLIMPLGLGFSFVAVTISATAGVPAEESGLASGILNTTQQVGGAVGLAILSSVASARTTAILATGGTDPLAQTRAVVEGFHSAFYTGMGFALLACIIALVFIRPLAPSSGAPVHSAL